MRVRLAFSVAAHLEPEIVLVDEVLAVGDAEFQAKCLGKMDNVARSGRTVIFVSHNMAAILSLCETIVLLERGRMIYKGESQAGIERYLKSGSASTGGQADLSDHPNRVSGRMPIIRHTRLLNGSEQPTDQFQSGKPIAIELLVDSSKASTDFNCGIQFEDSFGRRLFTVSTLLSDSACVSRSGLQRLVCHLDQLPLAPGRYLLNFAAKSTTDVQLDKIDQAIWFEVTAGDFYGNGRLPKPNGGPFLVRSHWSANEA
jgi:lipopolysaccharide transport system ATP-binding protein